MLAGSTIYAVMTADIKQDDFLLRHQQGQSDAITPAEADSMAAGQLAGKWVRLEMGLEGFDMKSRWRD